MISLPCMLLSLAEMKSYQFQIVSMYELVLFGTNHEGEEDEED